MFINSNSQSFVTVGGHTIVHFIMIYHLFVYHIYKQYTSAPLMLFTVLSLLTISASNPKTATGSQVTKDNKSDPKKDTTDSKKDEKKEGEESTENGVVSDLFSVGAMAMFNMI